jgi:hypothetical protein
MSQREASPSIKPPLIKPPLIKPPRPDPAAEGRAGGKSVAEGGLCLTYLAQNLVSDQKKIWTSPLHLQCLA